MTDVHSHDQRSFNMSRIRGKDTKPEVLVRKYLYSRGFRFRKNLRTLPGKPDIVLSKYRTCIFINGCFWHRHDACRYFTWPKSNTECWKEKINSNVERDERNYALLKNNGWKVIIVWECELKKDKICETLENLEKQIRDNDSPGESRL